MRDALGVVPPGGLPQALPRAGRRTRCACSSGGTRGRAGRSRPREVAARLGLEPSRVEAELAALERDEQLVRGELRPGGTEREWCDPDVLRRIRRATLAVLRREVEPAEQAALGRFLPAWHGIGRRQTLREALVPLQALALPVSLWESDVLPRRVPGYRPADLDALCASGDVVWVGAGLDRVAVYFRDDAAVLGRSGRGGRRRRATRTRRCGRRSGRARSFWADLVAATGLEPAEALAALWDLVWAGEVTNDSWAPLRAPSQVRRPPRPERGRRRFSRSRATAPSPTQGRWSLALAAVLRGRPRTGARSRSSCSSGRGS